MLVLTRKQRQQITIGENITITVLRIKGQAVRIGIEAPEGVRILRAELNAIDKAFEDESLLDDASSTSSMQRTENNGRRSRLGQDLNTDESREQSNPTRSMKAPGNSAPTAHSRPAPVSLLSFR